MTASAVSEMFAEPGFGMYAQCSAVSAALIQRMRTARWNMRKLAVGLLARSSSGVRRTKIKLPTGFYTYFQYEWAS